MKVEGESGSTRSVHTSLFRIWKDRQRRSLSGMSITCVIIYVMLLLALYDGGNTSRDIFNRIIKKKDLISNVIGGELAGPPSQLYEKFSDYWPDIMHKRL